MQLHFWPLLYKHTVLRKNSLNFNERFGAVPANEGLVITVYGAVLAQLSVGAARVPAQVAHVALDLVVHHALVWRRRRTSGESGENISNKLQYVLCFSYLVQRRLLYHTNFSLQNKTALRVN